MRELGLRGWFTPARPPLRLLLSPAESAALRDVMRSTGRKPADPRPRRRGGWWRRLLRYVRRGGRMNLLEHIERDRGGET